MHALPARRNTDGPVAAPGPLVVYFVITFAASWTLWTLAWFGRSATLFFLGVFAPGIVAVLVTYKEGGRPAVSALVGRLFDWHLGARWYLFALGFFATIKLSAALVHWLFMGVWPRFGDEPWLVLLVGTIGSVVIGGQAGEEVGWRGYALPRLADRVGLAWASVILGVIWAAWHLPLFFAPEADLYRQSFPVYAAQVTGISVALGWLYMHTRGSLLPAMLLHAGVNHFKQLVPSAPEQAAGVFALHAGAVGWLTLAVLWLAAGYFLFDMTFRSSTPQQVRWTVAE